MKTITAIIACFVVIGCGRQISFTPPPTPPGMIRISDAKLVLDLPEGWVRMPKEQWYCSRGFSAAFQKGEDPKIPSSYFLVQVKSQEKWSKARLQSLATNATALENTQDLTAYISDGKFKSKPELYIAKYDMFLHIQEYPDGNKQSITVMAKRFCEHHYVVFHFYLRDSLETDVGMITSVLKSISFDVDLDNRSLSP